MFNFFQSILSAIGTAIISIGILFTGGTKVVTTPVTSTSTTPTEIVATSTQSVNKNFYMTPTTVPQLGRIYAYNSGFNNEYSELCFENVNPSPGACSGASVPTDFDVRNPVMSFIIPSTISVGPRLVQVCGLAGEGMANKTAGCTKDFNIYVVSSSGTPTVSTPQGQQVTISSLRIGDFTIPGIWKTTDYSTDVKWTIDYTKAIYYENWYTGTTTLSRLGDFNTWLQQNKEMTSPQYQGDDIPGMAQITGIIDPITGVLHATIISQEVQ